MTHICNCKSHLSTENINTIIKYLKEKNTQLTNRYYSYSIDYMSDEIRDEMNNISNIISNLYKLRNKGCANELKKL